MGEEKEREEREETEAERVSPFLIYYGFLSCLREGFFWGMAVTLLFRAWDLEEYWFLTFPAAAVLATLEDFVGSRVVRQAGIRSDNEELDLLILEAQISPVAELEKDFFKYLLVCVPGVLVTWSLIDRIVG